MALKHHAALKFFRFWARLRGSCSGRFASRLQSVSDFGPSTWVFEHDFWPNRTSSASPGTWSEESRMGQTQARNRRTSRLCRGLDFQHLFRARRPESDTASAKKARCLGTCAWVSCLHLLRPMKSISSCPFFLQPIDPSLSPYFKRPKDRYLQPDGVMSNPP